MSQPAEVLDGLDETTPEAKQDNPIQRSQQLSYFAGVPFHRIKDVNGDYCFVGASRGGKTFGNQNIPSPLDSEGKRILTQEVVLCIRPLRHNGELVNPRKGTKDGKAFVIPFHYIMVSYNLDQILAPGVMPDLEKSRSLSTCTLIGAGVWQSRVFNEGQPDEVTVIGIHGECARNLFWDCRKSKKEPAQGQQPTYTLMYKAGGGTGATQPQQNRPTPTKKDDTLDQDSPF